MKPDPVNFADEGAAAPSFHRARTHFGLLSLCLVLAVLVIGFAYLAVSGSAISRITNQPFFRQLTHLITVRDRALKGEREDRINILLTGIGGAGHEGPYLTDTIILASFKPSTRQVALLSIPRDLAVNIPGGGWRKINAALSIGRDTNYPGGGDQLTAKVVSDVTGLPIHYIGRVDFAGFTKLINDLGGVQVTVDKTFTDYEYPTKNFGFQTIGFKAGPQRMNGDAALKYVRSRHGNNGEGSDFARARRQQKVLSALRAKIFSLSLLTSPNRLAQVLQTFGDHTRTNMEIWEMLRAATLFRSVQGTMITRVLDSSPDGLLRNETGVDGAFLLSPRTGDFHQIRTLARNIFTLDEVRGERSRIAINYALKNRVRAEQLSQELSLYTSTVVNLSSSTTLNEPVTVVYDLTNGQKPFTHQALSGDYEVRSLLDSDSGDGSVLTPQLADLVRKQSVDFLILLGQTSGTAAASTVPTRNGRSS